MNILAVDTATQVASIALLNEKKLISENIIDHKLKHSKKLIHSLDQMIENVELNFTDIDYFAVCSGPGSFTGLRIGLATMKALAQVVNKPVIPISTLEALSYNIAYSVGLICPMLDARRNQVYSALFKTDGTGRVERVLEDQAIDIPDLKKELSLFNEKIYLLGDGAEKFEKELGCSNGILVQPYLRLSHAASVGACSLNHLKEAVDFRMIKPNYLRPSYAEEK